MRDTKNAIESIKDLERFNNLLDQHSSLFLVLFYTEQSQKSLQSLEALEKLKEEHEDLPIYKVDASAVRDIHPKYDVHSVPTLIAFRNGKPTEIITGVQTTNFYENILKKPAGAGSAAGGAGPRVTVYTTPTCPYCNMVKQYLDQHQVSYTEVDVAADPNAAQELMQRTGQQGVPQTEIDGSFIIGYNTKELDKHLNL